MIKGVLTMANNIVPSVSIEQLIAQWIEAERNGVQFPVPLHDHWGIAGHTTKRKAFDLCKSILEEGVDLTLGSKTPSSKGGRPTETLFCTVAGLEHLCMAARTREGRNVRELYRQAKAKWDIVQQIAPSVAAEAELMAMKIELAKIEAQKEAAIASGKQADLQLIQFRHIVTTTMPEPIQQKILGYSEVKTVEYIDRTITPSGDTYDGVGITYIQKRYGFKSTAAAWSWLESIGCGKQSGHWETQLAAVERQSLPRDLLGRLDELSRSGSRQQFLGE